MGELKSLIMNIFKLKIKIEHFKQELVKYVAPRKFTVFCDSVKVLAKLKSKNLILDILLKVNNSHKD